MIGWVRAPRDVEKPYLLPAVRDLPELGRLTGRSDTLNLERLIAEKPDLVIDFGTINDTYRSLADRIQSQTGIPYLLIDGRFENTPTALRLLADILGVKERGETLARGAEEILVQVDRVLASVPADRLPRVYLARGPEGLETGSRGSINTEIIERAGAVNVVAGVREKGGIVTVSPGTTSRVGAGYNHHPRSQLPQGRSSEIGMETSTGGDHWARLPGSRTCHTASSTRRRR